MTEAQQRRLYFPAWERCARANHWVMERGRLVADLAKQTKDFLEWPGREHPVWMVGPAVIGYAEMLAVVGHRRVTAEDLRHGCNLVATGGKKESSGAMDNRETSRVVSLFALLEEPDNVGAVLEWLHPENAERRGLVSWIRKQAPEATLVAIARNAFGTVFWEDLDGGKLKWLAGQVKGRRER